MGEARGQTAQQELFQVVSSWRDGFRAQFEHIACTKAVIDGGSMADGPAMAHIATAPRNQCAQLRLVPGQYCGSCLHSRIT